MWFDTSQNRCWDPANPCPTLNLDSDNNTSGRLDNRYKLREKWINIEQDSSNFQSPSAGWFSGSTEMPIHKIYTKSMLSMSMTCLTRYYKDKCYWYHIMHYFLLSSVWLTLLVAGLALRSRHGCIDDRDKVPVWILWRMRALPRDGSLCCDFWE